MNDWGARGSEQPRAKLNEGQVIEIKRLLRAGKPQAEIAAAFGITQGAVSAIARGMTWSHVRVRDSGAGEGAERTEGEANA